MGSCSRCSAIVPSATTAARLVLSSRSYTTMTLVEDAMFRSQWHSLARQTNGAATIGAKGGTTIDGDEGSYSSVMCRVNAT